MNHVNVTSIHWSRREEHTHFSSPKPRQFGPRSFLGIGPQPCTHAESSYTGYISPAPILSALVASVQPIPDKGDSRGPPHPRECSSATCQHWYCYLQRCYKQSIDPRRESYFYGTPDLQILIQHGLNHCVSSFHYGSRKIR